VEQDILVYLLYRDAFYELLRDWEEHHLTAGWSVRQCQSEKIYNLINLGRDSLANCLHLARLFVLQLIQVNGTPESRHLFFIACNSYR